MTTFLMVALGFLFAYSAFATLLVVAAASGMYEEKTKRLEAEDALRRSKDLPPLLTGSATGRLDMEKPPAQSPMRGYHRPPG